MKANGQEIIYYESSEFISGGSHLATMPHRHNTNKTQMKSRKRMPLVSRLSNWWKRKQKFYLVQEDDFAEHLESTFEEEGDEASAEKADEQFKISYAEDYSANSKGKAVETTDSSPTTSSTTKATAISLPVKSREMTTTSLATPRPELLVPPIPPRPPYRLDRSRTADSFQGSLESIDSLVESYWDPQEEDTASQESPGNPLDSEDFLEEHIDFLRVKTNARKIKVVWASKPDTIPNIYSTN